MKQTVPFKGTHQSIRISSSKQKLQCSDSYSSRRKHLNSGSISSRFNTLLRKHMRHSVNRPPTPDARDDQDQEPTLQEIINIKLIESGEKERLMELLRERLIECGWKDDMRALCRAFIKKKGSNNVTVDDLVHVITPKGRASVPDSIKAELLQRIRTFLVSVAL
ncbi:transcription and mRNA export factor ENY2 [Cornus florida]|uniref:transcription and mRNA export factor ENY2 n=1 Tax=Cornus florida TaxID=4283 RepID=UPI0028A0C035|nr:transcription and mRNA export factor ENY2 [Cornus florida]